MTVDRALLGELDRVIKSGDAILFTGAGFSLGARDATGAVVPDSETMRRELFAMLFPGEEPDDSTLSDLYDVALSRAPHDLERYLDRRLRITQLCDPARYAAWLSQPWRRVYTLNVDDLELALMRTTALARPLHPISAGCEPEAAASEELAVVHLNGIASQGSTSLTFSTLQYAARLCNRDHHYGALIEDLDRWPFVFVGTTLDEVVLWQHLELHKQRGGRAPGRRSYLIARSLSRARHELLSDLGVVWIASTMEAVAEALAL